MLKEAIKFLVDLSIKPDERFVDINDPDGNDRTFVIDSEGNSKEIKPLDLVHLSHYVLIL